MHRTVALSATLSLAAPEYGAAASPGLALPDDAASILFFCTSKGRDLMQRAIALVVTCAATALCVASAEASCLSNFDAKGSILKGRVYTTYADFANVPVKVAVERLRQTLASQEIDVLSVDAEQGALNGKTRAAKGRRSDDVDFAVTPTSNGSRVSMVMTMPAGAFGLPGLRQWMCGVVALAATDAPSSSPDAAAAPAAAQPEAPAPEPALPAVEAAEPPAFHQDEPPLTNEEIVKLTAAGLGGDLIVAKIKQAASEAFDVSTDALISLRKKKVPSSVIGAMLQRVADDHKNKG
jgi:hypothetical protein